METKKFSTVEALRFGFYTVLENILFFLMLWGLYFSFLIVSIVIITTICFFPFLNTIVAFLREQDTSIMNTFIPKDYWQLDINNSIALLTGTILWGIITTALYRFLSLGVVRICLDFYDYKTSNLKQLFSGLPLLSRGYVAGIFYAVTIHIGVIFSLIPFVGVFIYILSIMFLTAKYGFYEIALVDKNLSSLQSLKESSRLTYGSIGAVFGLLCIMYFLNIIAALFLGLGLLVTLPAFLLAKTYVYRKLNLTPVEIHKLTT